MATLSLKRTEETPRDFARRISHVLTQQQAEWLAEQLGAACASVAAISIVIHDKSGKNTTVQVWSR